MKSAVPFAIYLCLAGAAYGDCLTAEDFQFETTFLHKDGGETRVTLSDDEPGAVETEYRDSGGEPLRWTWMRHGIYPVGEQMNLSVAGMAQTTPWPMQEVLVQTEIEAEPPLPVQGGAWEGRGLERRQAEDGARDWPFGVTYRFDAEKIVTLSGCKYRTIGVDAAFTAKGAEWTNGLIGIDN